MLITLHGVHLLTVTTVQLFSNGIVGNKNWREIFEALPGMYAADVSRVYFTSQDNASTVTGTFTLSPFDEGKILINWDTDSFPSDTVIADVLVLTILLIQLITIQVLLKQLVYACCY